MTINLQKIELNNIRSHKNIVFTPEAEGVTAISGPNGSGKSTIVDSIAWALYGQKPPGVSKIIDIARKGCAPGKDDVSAKVWLEVDQKTLLIERKIVTKGGAVECSIWEINGDKKTLVAGPAVSHAEPEIRKRLGMNSQGFLSAILVQQKQVDQLILAGPKERTQVIERLTGIDSITNAQQQARDEYNSLKKLLNATSEVEDLGALEKELTTLSKDNKILKNKAKKLKKTLAGLKDELNSKRAEYSEAAANRERSESLKNKISQLKAGLDEIEPLLGEVIEERVQAKSELGSKSSDDIERLSRILKKAEAELSSLKSKKAVDKNNLKSLENELSENSSLIEKSKMKSLEEVGSKLESIEASIEDYQRTSSEAEKKNAAAKSMIKQFNNAIEVLEKGACPTCLQKVSDSRSAIEELEAEIASLSSFDNFDYSKEIDLLVRKQKAFEKVRAAIERNEKIVSEIKELETVITSTMASIKTAEGLVSDARKNFNIASRNKELLDRYKKVSDRAKSLTVRKNKMLTAVENYEIELGSFKSLSNKSFNSLKHKVEELREDIASREVAISDLNGSLNLSEERLGNLLKDIKKGKENQAAYSKLLKSVEVAANSSSLIEEFRVNRINTSIPLIEGYASDLINRFTEGKFSGIKLDAKFNASVILADGSSRPIGLLSGGELSAASIALRLAISLLLNSESGSGLIVLDEVFVSQDRDRAEIILNTISEVCKGQVIIIAHNDSIDAIADRVETLG